MTNKKLTNAQKFAYALKRNGVEYIFGQSNPSKIMLAAMDIGIRQIAFRQENSGTYMAQGYSMMTGKTGVVAAQNGPAATLLVPGLAEDLKAGHPVIAIVQEVPLNHAEKNAFQELDHEKLFMGCAKWVKKIYSAERIEDYVDMAFMAANEGKPGPAVLLCPTDIFNDTQETESASNRKMNLGHYPLDRKLPDPDKIQEAARLLLGASRPFVYAGGGVFSSGAVEELRAMQEEFSLPVATTTMGKGSVDELHPLSIGVIGYYMGNRSSTKFLKPMVQEADVILLVGNRTNQNGTDSWTLLPENASYIHIDIDSMEIGRNYESLRLAGDAKLTLKALSDAMRRGDVARRHENRQSIERRIAEARELHKQEITDVTTCDSSPIRIERFMTEVEKQLSDDHIVVADASFSSIWNANYLSAVRNRKFLFPRGLAGLGWGMPMAMGAKLAEPKRPVFCLTGDGGFAHVWSELEACKREKIDVVCAVINNNRLGYQYFAELYKFGAYTNACDIDDVDYVKIAEACGHTGFVVEKPGDIADVLEKAFAARGTVIIDVRTDADCTPPLPFIDQLKLSGVI